MARRLDCEIVNLDDFLYALAARRPDGETVYWKFADSNGRFLGNQVDDILRAVGIAKWDWLNGIVDLSLDVMVPLEQDTSAV